MFRNTVLRPSASSALGLMLCAALAGNAVADEEKSMFRLGGFGTVGAARSSIDSGDYIADLFSPHGAGYSKTWSPSVDSKAAVQVDAALGEQFSAVLQVVATNQINNVFAPRVEWANLKYAVTPEFSVRVGRTALPLYLVSDTRKIGFANAWLRPPIESYSLFPITSVDGVDATYRKRLGEVNNTVQAWAGKYDFDFMAQDGRVVGPVIGRRIRGMADTLEYGALTLHAGVVFANMTIPVMPGVKLPFNGRTVTVGAAYDPGTWFVQTEYSKFRFSTIARAENGFYATAGYRWNAFTPYVIHSQVRPDDNQAMAIGRDQSTASIGLRWDAMKNTDIKVQFDRVKLGKNDFGFFTNAKPGLPGSSGNVASVVVDFVF